MTEQPTHANVLLMYLVHVKEKMRCLDSSSFLILRSLGAHQNWGWPSGWLPMAVYLVSTLESPQAYHQGYSDACNILCLLHYSSQCFSPQSPGAFSTASAT